MNTPSAAGASDSTAGRDAAWIAYVLHGIGYLSAMMWLGFVGLIVNYVKRDNARGGYVNSHHQWMIRTFWFGLLWYLLSLAAILWSAWPVLQSVLRAAWAQSGYVVGWDTIFEVVGAAVLGGLGFLLTWLWLLYRVIRGMIHLASAKAVP